MLTRRSFFRRTIGALVAAAVAPFVPQPPITLFGGEQIWAPMDRITYMMNVVVLSPRTAKMLTGIGG